MDKKRDTGFKQLERATILDRLDRLENTVKMLESRIRELVSVNELKCSVELCAGCSQVLEDEYSDYCEMCEEAFCD